MKDFAEASKAVRDYIEENGLGIGNCPPFDVLDDAGKVIGEVTYGGRIFPPGTMNLPISAKWPKPLWENSKSA